MRKRKNIPMLKPIWWIAFFVVQALFIVGGLALIFWTLNTWEENRKLDAIFGAGMGAYAFLFAWRTLRKWVRSHLSQVMRNPDSVHPEIFDGPVPHGS